MRLKRVKLCPYHKTITLKRARIMLIQHRHKKLKSIFLRWIPVEIEAAKLETRYSSGKVR